MVKKKSRANILVANGTGGMVQVQDKRFEGGAWPIKHQVQKEYADKWLHHLEAHLNRNGYRSSSLGQLDAQENSGSITVTKTNPLFTVVWERKRNQPLEMRARVESPEHITISNIESLFQDVDRLSAEDYKESFYFRGYLEYRGLPWLGEAWLSEKLRLAPPNTIDDSALDRPRIIVVDALVDGIDRNDATTAFHSVTLRELSVFLTIVMRTEVRTPRSGHAWTLNKAPDSKYTFDVRQLGYWERTPNELPEKGTAPEMPITDVARPDLDPLRRGVAANAREQTLPADIFELWETFDALPSNQRRQFIEAGSLCQLALSLGREWETTSFALMVVTCEALKPRHPQFNRHNIYHVTEALLGKTIAETLRQNQLRPQEVRNINLHSGAFRGSQFAQILMTSSFQDPSFRQVYDALSLVTPAAFVEWLKHGGLNTLPPLKRRNSLRRWLRRHPSVIFLLGVGIGLLFSLFY